MIDRARCGTAIHSLIKYAEKAELLNPLDEIYVQNALLCVMGAEGYEAGDEAIGFPACLEELCDLAAENGRIENTVTGRDLFDTRLMGVLTPQPSAVIDRFRKLYSVDRQNATDYFYKLSQDCNYIRRDRTARDLHWTTGTEYGDLEISINLSKPEKDPKEIAAAGRKATSGYPRCSLCMENEGYAGSAASSARENLRIIPIEIDGEPWGFQYSPYVYYNEHCIVMNSKHVPMTIDRAVFHKLFSFVEQFPHYFIGSNADLPIVGGSILSHEHFQGGRHIFPMERADKELVFTVAGFEDVKCATLKYPMTVLRLDGGDKERVCALAARILDRWRTYTDPEAFIFAETGGERHNTITPIARMKDGVYELDLVLRNNITTPEHPLGVFHPHAALHHIKRENIGLIEVMGLAILPGRLKAELREMKAALLNGDDLRNNEGLAKHADWAEEIVSRHSDWSEGTADAIIREELGRVFEQVLECAGVFKRTQVGRGALARFLSSL